MSHGKVVLKSDEEKPDLGTCSTMSASRGERKAISAVDPSWNRFLWENRNPKVLLRERCKILEEGSPERTS